MVTSRQCGGCQNYIGDKVCLAFNEIPEKFLLGYEIHDTLIKDQFGDVVYNPEPGLGLVTKKGRKLSLADKVFKDLAGRGNWQHGGLEGVHGGSTPTGGASDAFLEHPGELRHSFDINTGEFSVDRHLKYVSQLSEDEYSEYMDDFDKYVNADKEFIDQLKDDGKIDEDVEIENISLETSVLGEKYSTDDLAEMAAENDKLIDGSFLAGTYPNERIADRYLKESDTFRGFVYGRMAATVREGTFNKIAEMEADGEIELSLSELEKLEDRLLFAEEEFGSTEELKAEIEGYGLDPDQIVEDVMDEQVTNATHNLLRTWASTSGDHNYEAVSLQLAAQEEFGLEDSSLGHLPPDIIETAKEDWYTSETKGAYKEFLRAQYKETQDHLEDIGIDSVVVYRGMNFTFPPEGLRHMEFEDQLSKGKLDFKASPLTSFSTSPVVAARFAEYGGVRRQYQVVIGTEVPKEKIFSLPGTGFGCQTEREAVILGGNLSSDAISFKGEVDNVPRGSLEIFAGEAA